MRNLLLLLSKFGTLILFLVLEIISIFLIVNYNNKQKEIFLYSSNLFSGRVMDKYDATLDYLSLKTQNDSILTENARLLSMRLNARQQQFTSPFSSDTLKQYFLIPSGVCNKTINIRNNRMTLDQGTDAGIESGMGVISENGIVGVVQKVNNRFASIIPSINTQFQLSVKVKEKNHFGDLIWEPYDERIFKLQHIPKHAVVQIGDTIITSGYSTIFPPDIYVGVIQDIRLPSGSNYFDIKVESKNLFSNLEYVYVVDNQFKSLQMEIETDR